MDTHDDDAQVHTEDAPSPDVDMGYNNGRNDTEFISPMDLLTITAPKIEDMYIPELDKNVRVKALNARERDAYEQSLMQGKGANQSVNMRNARAKLAVMVLVDANGQRLYRDNQANDLGNAPAIVIERIFDRGRRLAGITNEDLDQLTGN
jgi:hypothetical protein